MNAAPSLSTSTDAVESPRYLCVVDPGATDASSAEGSVPPSQRKVWPCVAGQVIAAVVVAEQVPHSPGRLCALAVETAQLGKNVQWNSASTAVIAQKAGHIVIKGDRLSVEEILEIVDDLDVSAGPIDFPGPVVLRRNVMDLVKLSATGDITIRGSVEAASVHTAGNLVVHHGICGKDTGRITAQGNVSARFTSNAHIHATNVHVDNEVANSRIICRGEFVGPQASVLSGHISAFDGIDCETAGSEAGVRVILELTIPPEEFKRLRETTASLKALRRKSQQIRSALEPLMQNPKFLNPKQREKATELLCTAAEADDTASGLAATLAQSRQQVDALFQSAIRIQRHLYPGVIVSIAGVEGEVRKPLRGPLSISLREEAGVLTMLALDDHQRILANLPIVTTDENKFLNQLRKSAD